MKITYEHMATDVSGYEKMVSYSVEKNIIKKNYWYLFWKRFFDLTLALILFTAFLVPMAIIAIIIKIDSKGPAFFKQERMGEKGKIFTIYKFRTMSIEAPSDVATSRFEDAENYITKFGAFLRRTSIDEVPQLVNIIKGDMSFVGYRPVCLTEKKLNKLRSELGVHESKPGLTGLAQIRGRDNISYVEKAYIDAEYMERRSLWFDFKCLLKTVEIVLSGEGAM